MVDGTPFVCNSDEFGRQHDADQCFEDLLRVEVPKEQGQWKGCEQGQCEIESIVLVRGSHQREGNPFRSSVVGTEVSNT